MSHTEQPKVLVAPVASERSAFPRLRMVYPPGYMDGPRRHRANIYLDTPEGIVQIPKVRKVSVAWDHSDVLTATIEVIIAGVDEVEEEEG